MTGYHKIKNIQELEKFPYLRIDEKVEELLVQGGFKLATEVDYDSGEWYDGKPKKSVPVKKIMALQTLLKSLGLKFEKRIQVVKSKRAHKSDGYKFVRNIERARFVFAKTRAGLQKYKNAERLESDELFGKVYGYPKTAIRAFTQPNQTIKYKDLPMDIKKNQAYAFLTFKPSQGNYRKEFQTAQRWSEFVKQKSPKIHRAYVAFMRKVKGR